MKNNDKNGPGKSPKSVNIDLTIPESKGQFGFRLRQAIPKGMTQQVFATKIGASVSGLRKWLAGDAEPGIGYLPRIAEVTGVSIEWLATGEGPMIRCEKTEPPQHESSPVGNAALLASHDEELMGRLVDGILAVYKEEGVGLPPRDLGRLAERMRIDLINDYDDPDERRIAVKAALSQLRRNLRDAPVGTISKRQA